jgi:hypothetical protein
VVLKGYKTYHVDDAAVGKLATVDGHEDVDVVLGGGVVGQVGAHCCFDGGDGEVVTDGLEVAAPLVESFGRGDAVVSALDLVRVQHGYEGADDAHGLPPRQAARHEAEG